MDRVPSALWSWMRGPRRRPESRPGVGTLVCLFVVAVLGPRLMAQQTWYVDDNAPGDPGPGNPAVSDPLEDGSAAHPYDAIQQAVNRAADSDTVLVLPGTYRGNGNRNIGFFGK